MPQCQRGFYYNFVFQAQVLFAVIFFPVMITGNQKAWLFAQSIRHYDIGCQG